MTEKLKTLMHEQAESVDFATPDLDAMTRTGDRRRRVRASAYVGGLAAVAITAALLVPALGGDTARPDVATDPPQSAPLSWVTGSVLHTSSSETDLDVEVDAYVRTATGLVLADRDGTVWSWVDGSATEVGRIGGKYPELVSDDESDLAGWVDTSEAQPAFAVLDVATGSVERYDVEDSSDTVTMYGIDAGTAFWSDARGAVAVDLATGDSRPVDLDLAAYQGIGDVENGLIAFVNLGGEVATVVGTSPDDGVGLEGAYGSTGAFSPDGRWYSSEGDEQAVFDTTTGEQVTLDLPQKFATGYEWLDATTLAVLAADRPRMDATAQLLTCTVPAGACELVVPDLGTFEEIGGSFALPTGDYAG